MDKDINVTLKIWRQKGPKEKGHFETYPMNNINQSVSFLEMLDILNERLVNEGKEPVVFDHDCICVVSTMAKQSQSNRGVLQASL